MLYVSVFLNNIYVNNNIMLYHIHKYDFQVVRAMAGYNTGFKQNNTTAAAGTLWERQTNTSQLLEYDGPGSFARKENRPASGNRFGCIVLHGMSV